MLLSSLLEDLQYTCLNGSTDAEIKGVAYDSRDVEPGSLFVCIRGTVKDGNTFAGEALKRGAAALVSEEFLPVPEEIPLIRVENARKALARISAAWFGYPARKLILVGVTGTKGKTTTAWMVRAILEQGGYKTGLLGTVSCITGKREFHSENTTPESWMIHQCFAEMAEAGMRCAVMEVSSQALKQYRVEGISFDCGIFTNIEADHIGPGEHRDFQEYLECKKKLLAQCRVGIVNRDDPHFQEITEGRNCVLETFGFSENADLRAEHLKLISAPGRLGISFQTRGLLELTAELEMPGRFSVYNALGAMAAARHLGVTKSAMRQALKKVRVRGRAELLTLPSGAALVIDYAHNAISLKNILTALREYRPKRLICLFGCGGNRDRNRRFEMGEVSGNCADLTVITSDNPRDEEPQAIIEDIKGGIRKTRGACVEIASRREAVAWAVHQGEPGDIIVLAGKGHEDYQIIRGKKYPMDERIMIREILEEDRKRAPEQ